MLWSVEYGGYLTRDGGGYSNSMTEKGAARYTIAEGLALCAEFNRWIDLRVDTPKLILVPSSEKLYEIIGTESEEKQTTEQKG